MENEFKFGPGEQTLLARCLSEDLEAFCAKFYDGGPRWHLGASVIGEDCWRKIWYGFRWVYDKKLTGRMYRLFNRGHKEEFRFVEWLRGMGHIVEEYDTSQPLKNGEPQQFHISDVYGHFGGSCDGKITLTGKYAGLPKMLLEFKTISSKYFDKLVKLGVKIEKPQHYTQMCSYGKRMGLRYALYMCVNKDTDEIYYEIVELSDEEADRATIKAGKIIFSQEPPPRISENSAFYKCKLCDFAPMCHGKKSYDKNCRSCKFARPVDAGEWTCDLYNSVIPREFVPQGCDQHQEIR